MAQGFTEDTPRASELVQGKSKLSVPPVDPYTPIAVGDNDPRLNQLGNNLPSYFTGQAFAVWTGTGLIFDVIYPIYYLDSVAYPAGIGQVTLPVADPFNPRFDAIIVDASGSNFIPGDPAVDPILPTANPLTQLVVTYISILAGATTPAGVTEEVVYNENAEWTTASNNGTINYLSSPAFVGTYAIEIGAFNNGHYIRFTDSVLNTITSFSVLRFYIRLKAVFSIGTYLKLRLFNDATFVSSIVPIIHDGPEGFDRNNTTGYQIITVPIASFTMLNSQFNRVEITFEGSNASGFFLDYLTLQGGLGSGSPLPNFFGAIVDNDGNVVSPTIPNDTLTIKGSTKTGAKELTVDSGGGLEPYIDLASFPLTGSDGITYVAEDTGFIYYWDGLTYVQIGGGGIPGHEIIDQDENPLPQQTNLKFERLIVTDDNPNTQTIVTRPADTFVGTTAPSNPVEGDVWTDTNDTVWKTYVRYDGYWVERNAEGGGGGHEIQVDDVALDQEPALNFIDVEGEDDPSIATRIYPIARSLMQFWLLTDSEQDIFMRDADITKIVKGDGIDTVRYKINAGAFSSPLSFTGDTWTGSIDISAGDRVVWRITYNVGFNSGSFVYQFTRL